MEVESAVLPIIVRLNHAQRRYTLRILKLSQKHPIRAEFNKALAVCKLESDSSLSDSSSPSLRASRQKNQTQVQRLIGSIKDLVDLKTLEPIRHFYFPP